MQHQAAVCFFLSISLNIRLQYAYLMTSPRRKVDARFVDEVAKTYFPGVQKLLKNIADPETQRDVQRRMEEANRALKEDMDRLRQEKMMQELVESTVSDDHRSLQRNVVTNVKNKEQGMEDAVNAAYKMAKKGETVLLSPCCASFDLFKSYEDRGEQFKKCVRNL